MDDEVFGLDVNTSNNDEFCKNSRSVPSNFLSSGLLRVDVIENKMETVTEANDLLKNGILIETREGVELLSLTDALTTGVGGLNLSVEDFQHVAAQLLSNQQLPVASILDIPPKPLESIAEVGETVPGEEVSENVPEMLTGTVLVNDTGLEELSRNEEIVSESSSSLVGVSESANSDSSVQSFSTTQVKKKGGWPKGRKRKPELSDNRPPKAPSTGYVLYLNEKRKLFKNVPFHEVTKVLGNEWSKLSLEEKRVYLERAEVDKRRYREELRIYRKSEAYQSYLRRKRVKSLQANGTEESDVDATDELDDEDNEELYCRVCDQWFTTLHNKKEHLYGRQHFQSISQLDLHSIRSSRDGSSSHSLDESSLDGTPVPHSSRLTNDSSTVTDAIANVFQLYADREKEIKFLQRRISEQLDTRQLLVKEVQLLKLAENRLNKMMTMYKQEIDETEQRICDLWDVPSMFLGTPKYVAEENEVVVSSLAS